MGGLIINGVSVFSRGSSAREGVRYERAELLGVCSRCGSSLPYMGSGMRCVCGGGMRRRRLWRCPECGDERHARKNELMPPICGCERIGDAQSTDRADNQLHRS